MAPYDVESITDYLVHKQVQGEGGRTFHGYAVIFFHNPNFPTCNLLAKFQVRIKLFVCGILLSLPDQRVSPCSTTAFLFKYSTKFHKLRNNPIVMINNSELFIPGKLIGHLFTISELTVNENDQHLISLSTARVRRY